jgi:hypothetical protein
LKGCTRRTAHPCRTTGKFSPAFGNTNRVFLGAFFTCFHFDLELVAVSLASDSPLKRAIWQEFRSPDARMRSSRRSAASGVSGSQVFAGVL